MAEANPAREFTADEFFTGFLAAVALQRSALEGKRSDLHRAFNRAIHGEAGKAFGAVERFAIDYDPLYGLSPWFDRALTRAQRDLLLDFSNPSYKKVVLRLTHEEGERRLGSLGMPDAFKKLAAAFLGELPKR
jgi:hypothetical protein